VVVAVSARTVTRLLRRVTRKDRSGNLDNLIDNLIDNLRTVTRCKIWGSRVGRDETTFRWELVLNFLVAGEDLKAWPISLHSAQ
jgi:hypothetical protein